MVGEDKDARPKVAEAMSVEGLASALGAVAVSDGVGVGSTQSSDTSADGAAHASEEGEWVLDPELWKPHPPTEDCPVCFVPLPVVEFDSTYAVCCGKIICTACSAETVRAESIINAKRAKKKLSPLDNACPFCRSVVMNASESKFEERIRGGDGQAAYNLAVLYRVGDTLIDLSKDEVKSLELFHNAADDMGCSRAMKALGRMYSYGVFGAPKDTVKGREYLEDAVKMGDVNARYWLGCIEAEEENIDLAIRHWNLAAAAGEKCSVAKLWKSFFEGKLEKSELEEALRNHKEASDAMNSEERERCSLFLKTEKSNDFALLTLFRSYYQGEINAKQLKNALKLHKAQK